MMGPFVGQVHSQTVPAGSSDVALAEPKVLQERFTGFLERSRSLTRRIRLIVALVLVVPLAFLASRVEQPVAVGLCGLLVLVPLVWLSTALIVPMTLIGRAQIAQGAGLTMQAGVPITVDAKGLSAGETSFGWAAVTSVQEVEDALVIRGVDVPRRVVFQVLLAPKNFASAANRGEVLAALEALRVAAATSGAAS